MFSSKRQYVRNMIQITLAYSWIVSSTFRLVGGLCSCRWLMRSNFVCVDVNTQRIPMEYPFGNIHCDEEKFCSNFSYDETFQQKLLHDVISIYGKMSCYYSVKLMVYL